MKKVLVIFAYILLLSSCSPNTTETYLVSFDSIGGTLTESQNVAEGDFALEPEIPTKDNYIFVYWYSDDEEEEFDFDNIINSDIELTALWDEVLVFSVNFDSMEGTIVASQIVVEGESALEPEIPVKGGYEFAYWYLDDEEVAFDFDSMISTDIELKALWDEIIIFTIDFDSIGGTIVTSQNVIEGEVALEPNIPTKEDYLFVYWYLNDEEEEYDFGTTISSDIELKALWYKLLIFTIYFDSMGGTEVEFQNVTEGEVPQETIIPKKDDSLFLYWYADDEDVAFDFDASITSDITLYAKFVEDTNYMVIYSFSCCGRYSDVTKEQFMDMRGDDEYISMNIYVDYSTFGVYIAEEMIKLGDTSWDAKKAIVRDYFRTIHDNLTHEKTLEDHDIYVSGASSLVLLELHNYSFDEMKLIIDYLEGNNFINNITIGVSEILAIDE